MMYLLVSIDGHVPLNEAFDKSCDIRNCGVDCGKNYSAWFIQKKVHK